jgi:hypothetical protein
LNDLHDFVRKIPQEIAKDKDAGGARRVFALAKVVTDPVKVFPDKQNPVPIDCPQATLGGVIVHNRQVINGARPGSTYPRVLQVAQNREQIIFCILDVFAYRPSPGKANIQLLHQVFRIGTVPARELYRPFKQAAIVLKEDVFKRWARLRLGLKWEHDCAYTYNECLSRRNLPNKFCNSLILKI